MDRRSSWKEKKPPGENLMDDLIPFRASWLVALLFFSFLFFSTLLLREMVIERMYYV